MAKKWFLTSVGTHLGIVAILCLINPNRTKEIIVKVISQKDLEKKIKDAQQDQVVSTDKLNTDKQPLNLQKIYLSDKNQKSVKNTRAKNSDKFKNSGGDPKPKSTSILQKGKFTPEKKGKGISSSDDFIDGAEIGPMTILNTQEFKYFTYYDRIKQQVAENWRPLIRKAINTVKNNPKKYGTLEIGFKTTKLNILLDEKGKILEITVVQSSGYEPFDKVAIEAFEKSAPFSQPPKELVKNKHFQLRWDFTVNVEESGLIQFEGNNH